jgi:hypothetical protein
MATYGEQAWRPSLHLLQLASRDRPIPQPEPVRVCKHGRLFGEAVAGMA